MKPIDKLLRYWRVTVAIKNIPEDIKAVYDIGCDDGYLLRKFKDKSIQKDGIDPLLSIESIDENSVLNKGYFPQDVSNYQKKGQYDAIFSLAVFEHLNEKDLEIASLTISNMLSENGRLIVTVPHHFVDKILNILQFLRLVDGISLEEHHGFVPTELPIHFSKHLHLVSHKRFQFGLNNIFIFENS